MALRIVLLRNKNLESNVTGEDAGHVPLTQGRTWTSPGKSQSLHSNFFMSGSFCVTSPPRFLHAFSQNLCFFVIPVQPVTLHRSAKFYWPN
jgi:hypothetical protein